MNSLNLYKMKKGTFTIVLTAFIALASCKKDAVEVRQDPPPPPDTEQHDIKVVDQTVQIFMTTGKSYVDFIKEDLMKPLGATQTDNGMCAVLLLNSRIDPSAGDTRFVQEMQSVLLDMVKNPTHPWQDIDQFEE